MDSLDLFDYTVPVAPTKPLPPGNAEASSSSASSTTVTEHIPSQPTFNEEVTQVIGQLNRFWGGVRKQSQSAFEAARKDLGGVVTQAQKELEKFSQRPAVSTPAQVPEITSERTNVDTDHAQADTGPTSEVTPEGPPASSSFFSRLQSSLPPNFAPTALSTTLQRHLPENLRHGLNLENANADFAQLRTTLVANIQRVQQGTTVQQAEKLAEEYMHKGEALFKEAGEFLKDAVKIVPPEENGEAPGVVWDGTDVWTMPAPIQTNVWRGGRGGPRKGKGKESDVIFSIPKAAAKRADVMLKRLRSNVDVIRQDPQLEEDDSTKEMWSAFLKDKVEADGGMGGEVWMAKISAALEGHDEDDGAKSLIDLRDKLVPTELTNDVFWARYFFRVHQIECEEEQRKALLAGANQDDEDFSWEDEDDEEGVDGGDDELSQSQSTKTPVDASSSMLSASPQPSTHSTTTATAPSQNAQDVTSQSTSPRLSEDSYDVVSSGNVSSTSGKILERKPKEDAKSVENGEDSDWE